MSKLSKIKIITDSVSDLPSDLVSKWDIEVVPLSINFQEETYKDGIDITNEVFYKKLRECTTLPTTSQVNTIEFLDVYKKFYDEYDHFIVITISSELSGTYQSAVSAGEDQELKDKVTVIDSKGITLGQGLIVLEAARMAKRGEEKDAIIKRINNMIKKIEYILVVDTLEYLKKGGRLSATKAFVGQTLKIKPVLTMQDGKLIQSSKIRGRKKVISWIIKQIEKSGVDLSTRTIGINHTDSKEFACQLKEKIQKKFTPKEIVFGDVGATVGTHAGPGAVAVYFEKN